MHRRRFLQASAATGLASTLIRPSGQARQTATPGATPRPTGNQGSNLTLGELVAQVAPQSLLDALLATPVVTPLFPADTPSINPVAWEDDSDDDLVGTVGAVRFTTGYDENENPLAVGNAIVFPDEASASTRFDNLAQDPASFLEMPWTVETGDDYAVSALRIANVFLVGGAEIQVEQVPDAPSEADPRLVAQMTSRAIIHMTALTDHVRDVLAEVV